MRIYSFSRLQAFVTCSRKFRYKYIDGFDIAYEGAPLPVGKATHTGIDSLYLGATIEDALARAKEAFWAEIGGVYEQLDPKEKQKLDGGWKQVEGMLVHYPYKDTSALETSEETFVMDMGRGRHLKSILDRRMKSNGDVWVHDTKTSGYQLDKILKIHRLRKQFPLYKLIADAEYGVDHIGVMLDLIYKPQVYWKKTGEFSSMREPAYHREPLHISDAMVEDAKVWFHYIADQIEKNEDEHGPWLQNTEACLAYNRTCPYFECCRMPTRAVQLMSGDGRFKKREEDEPNQTGGEALP